MDELEHFKNNHSATKYRDLFSRIRHVPSRKMILDAIYKCAEMGNQNGFDVTKQLHNVAGLVGEDSVPHMINKSKYEYAVVSNNQQVKGSYNSTRTDGKLEYRDDGGNVVNVGAQIKTISTSAAFQNCRLDVNYNDCLDGDGNIIVDSLKNCIMNEEFKEIYVYLRANNAHLEGGNIKIGNIVYLGYITKQYLLDLIDWILAEKYNILDNVFYKENYSRKMALNINYIIK